MEELKRIANERRKDKKRVSNKSYWAENPEAGKNTQDERARKYREKNPDAGKNTLNARVKAFRQRENLKILSEDDYEERKKAQNKWQQKCMDNKREKNPEATKEVQRLRKQKSRETKTAAQRLAAFREATMFGAVFLCVSCHGKMFRSNVQEFTETLEEKINEKCPLKDYIDVDLVTKLVIMYNHCTKRKPQTSSCDEIKTSSH